MGNGRYRYILFSKQYSSGGDPRNYSFVLRVHDIRNDNELESFSSPALYGLSKLVQSSHYKVEPSDKLSTLSAPEIVIGRNELYFPIQPHQLWEFYGYLLEPTTPLS